MNELPSPVEIKYFQQLARVGHVTRTAELVGVTQPALSTAIKRLEEKIGSELFIRSKKGVELTRVGQSFLSKSQDLIQAWEELAYETKQEAVNLKSRYRLGIHPSVAIICLPDSLVNLKKKYPQVSLSIVHSLSRNINEMILTKEVDFGIVVNPRPHPDLVLQKLCKDEVKLWSSSKIEKDTLIYDPKLFQSSFVLQEIRRKQSYENYLEVGSLELIRELGLSGLGDVILPSRVANKPKQKALFKERKASPVFKDEFYFVRNMNMDFNKNERVFLRNFFQFVYQHLN